MTQNRRIILNVIATYGRSLYALVIGLFTARWVLMALGEVDFGLYGVVGGLTAFVVLINELFAMAVARFYGVSVGAASREGNENNGLEECRKWFNTALLLHTVLPVVLVLIGYPIGEWAVKCFLNIPPDRIYDCIWVWRFTCISCFVGMVNVPYRAMYTAKQEIAELTIYSFATTTLTFLGLWYMVYHPGKWLMRYALLMSALSIAPNCIIMWRAIVSYRECRFVSKYIWDWQRVKSIIVFAAARFINTVSMTLVSQGQAILVNKYLGPVCNATMRVGSTVVSNTATLAGSLTGAFWPAITNTIGRGEDEKARSMCFQVSRISVCLVLIFSLPLMLECDEVLKLWLDNPPKYSVPLCVAVLTSRAVDGMTEGHWMAVLGFGRGVTAYSCCMSVSGFVGFGVAWIFMIEGYGMMSVYCAILASAILSTWLRLWLGRRYAALSIKYWIRTVGVPLTALALFVLVLGYQVRLMLAPSFFRIVLTTIVCEIVFLPVAWFAVLTNTERTFVASKVNAILRQQK